MKIKFVEPYKEYLTLKKEIDRTLKVIMKRGQFILGEEVKNFESEFAKFCGVRFAIGVNSGTDALRIALLALRVGSDDAIITSPFTFPATAEAIIQIGALPIFVDIDEKTLTLSVEKTKNFLEERVRNGKDKITGRKVKGIIAVHLFGNMCNMVELLKLSKENNMFIVEDSAQAHGSEINMGGKIMKAGAIGNAGCFSFYPTKNLAGMGDGGCITTNSKLTASTCKMIRNHGRDRHGIHRIVGWNSRLDEIQAGILRIKLRKLNQWNKRRRRFAEIYRTVLDGVGDLKFMEPTPGSNPAPLVFPIITKYRNKLMKHLAERGIETKIYYPTPLHKLPHFSAKEIQWDTLKNSEEISKKILCLPVHPFLTETDVEYICESIAEFYKK